MWLHTTGRCLDYANKICDPINLIKPDKQMYKNYTNKLRVPYWCTLKVLLIMRLTTILLIATMMQVSAATFAQKVSLSEKNTPLAKIFKKITRQTGYGFFVGGNLLKQSKPVTIKVTNMELSEALIVIFKDQPISFNIEYNSVVVSEKVKTITESPSAPVNTQITVTGKITDSIGTPLPGATITIKGTDRQVVSDQKGEFILTNVNDNAILKISYVGYGQQEIRAKKFLNVVLKPYANKLDEVFVVNANNGYQDIPKERATGSFEVITAKQLKHSTSGNLLQRLEGITTSIVFNNTSSPINSAANSGSVNPATGSGISPQSYTGGYTLDNMTIRGKNTLSTNGSGNPLVVIDGIASPYDISLINPEDVVSITILKDAAAASIWGSRAANGVLVIKTKRGEFNRPPVVSFNGNISISEKPDLYYLKPMTTSDYIDAEIYGFKQANTSLATPNILDGSSGRLVSPVAEILDAINKGTLTAAEGNAQIDALRNHDIRKDQYKYLLRNAINQNYNLSISGGSKNIAYILTGGYQNLLNNTVKSNSDRVNLSYNMQMKPTQNLDIASGISFNATNKTGLGPLSLSLPFVGLSNLSPYFYPYTRLVDDNGNALAVPYYRPGFVSALNMAYGSKILDYTYNPLDDLNESYSKNRTQNLNFNLNANYKILPVLSLQLTYNYNLGNNKTEDYYNDQSIYVRDLVNRFTDPVTFKRNIPAGGFYNPQRGDSHNQTGRGLLSFNQTWNSKHEVNAILGTEIFDSKSTTSPAYGYYGYNPRTMQFTNVTYNTYFNTLFDPNFSTTAQIPNYPGNSFLIGRSRTVSEFLNAAYTYDRRYTVSGSVRKDGSSAFADQTNKTGTPFYSVGASWEINNEKFYNFSWIPYLKLRATFGYNGNSNPGATAYSRIALSTSTDYRTTLPYATVDNLSNSLLRPERTAITNIGLDFATKNNRLSGSLEYFLKITKDLLSYSPLDPTLGVSGQIFNVADLRGSGVDLRWRTINMKSGSFTWESNFNFSFNDVKVTKNYVDNNVGAISVLTGSNYFYEGNRLSSLYAFKWAGLDQQNGAARAMLGSKIDEDGYSETFSDLKNMGSAVPLRYGSISNTFSYDNLSLWANITYKLGYFQRRPASSLFLNGTQMNTYSPQQVAGIEYEQRWQKPGDENITNVPSRDINRGMSNDYLYQYADINVYKADNIRLQEVNLSYSFKKGTRYIKNPRIYVNVPVNVMIWRANKLGLDPDVYDYPIPRAYGFGFSANF